MRYSPSASRREFDLWLKEAVALVGASRTQTGNVREALLSASLFLTHARFENFFKDIVSLAVTKINGKKVTCDSLPGRLRAAHLISQFPHRLLKRFYILNDERILLDELHEDLARKDWLWAAAINKGNLNASVVIGSNGYPSTENLKRVFYKLGIKIMDECSQRMKTDVEALLEGINGLRGEIAHIGLPPTMSDNDIEKKIKDLGRTVETIDRIVHERFRIRAGASGH